MSAQEQPSPGVVVTLTQIYDQILEMRSDVTDIKTKLETLTSKTDDHESRIRSLERQVWAAGGAGGALGGFLTYLISVLR